jgi:V/A-type H+-transporting ATPase subunit K
MMEIILAYIGIAFLAGGSFVASAMGVTICGKAVIGAMKKNPDAFGTYIVLCALPASQGLYGFVGFIMFQPFLVPEITWIQASAIFATGILVAVAGIFANVRQGQVCAHGIQAVGAGHNVFASTMIMAVFPELYSILALLVTILVANSI